MSAARETRFHLSALAVAAGTLAVHALAALVAPLPGSFEKYPEAACRLLAGTLGDERLLDFSPLYLQLNVAVVRLGGDPAVLLGALQVILVALAAGLLFDLVRRRAGPLAGGLAAVTLAVDRHLLVYERLLEPEALQLFLVVVFLFFLDRAGAEGRWQAAFVAGLAAGLSVFTRPTLLPLFLLAPFFLALRRGMRPPFRALTAAALLPVLLAVALLALRGTALSGDPRTPVMNPGTVFFEGNNPLSRGTSAVYPPSVLAGIDDQRGESDVAHALYREVARASTGRELTVREVNAYWSGKAKQYLRDHPGRAISRAVYKLRLGLHPARLHDVPLADRYDAALHLPGVPFSLLAALALAGLGVSARTAWRADLPFAVLAAVQVAVMVVFYVSARQRLALLPALLLFAALVIAALIRAGRKGWPVWLAIGALAVLLSWPDATIADWQHQRRGAEASQDRRALLADRTREAPIAASADLAIEMLADAPWAIDRMRPAYLPQEEATVWEQVSDALETRADPSPSGRFDLAVASLRAGRNARARELLVPLAEAGWAAYRREAQPSDPRFYLARLALPDGEAATAEQWLEQALADTPGDPFVLAELVALTGDSTWAERLRRTTSDLDSELLLGQAHLAHGHGEQAAAHLRAVTEALPWMRRPVIDLAAALFLAGQDEEAARTYLEANRQKVEPPLHDAEILALFDRWLADHPERPDVRLYAAQVLRQYGYPTRALGLLEEYEFVGRQKSLARILAERLGEESTE